MQYFTGHWLYPILLLQMAIVVRTYYGFEKNVVDSTDIGNIDSKVSTSFHVVMSINFEQSPSTGHCKR